jgi:predicted Fe-Mo cluster-binding NifX family protein
MKIAISSSGSTLNAEVDPRFGRAANFIIYDTDTKDYKVVENSQNLHARQGAGIQAGQTVASTGVHAVLTGNCGPKAFSVLSQAGISVYVQVSGTVQEAIDSLLGGTLKPSDGANVEGHWM